MTKKNKKEKEGFTLVETLVAITILLLAVTAPLSLANKSLNSSALSKQQIIASFLAQEAMEYIRNARDENVLKGGVTKWLDGNSINKCLETNGCLVETVTASGAGQISQYVDKKLRYKESTGIYNYDSSSDTVESIYTRVVKITKVREVSGDATEIAIKVTVSWQGTNGANYEVVARENLTNWQF